MTEAEFVERLRVLAARKTYYKRKWPDNLCYVHNDLRTSADCVNLIKAVLNGYDVNNNTPNYYQKLLGNTGDCTETQLLEQCTDVSDDFSKLGNHCAILWMNKPQGHVGVYLGHNVTINGQIYNVVECTASWKGGILYSYVDADGVRRQYKGAKKNCQWMKYGRPTKWVSFDNSGSSEPSEPIYAHYPELWMRVDPKTKRYLTRGQYVTELQKLLVKKGYDPKGIDGVFGPGCDKAVRGFQKENTDIYGKQLVVDGCVGQKTWGALYK